MGKAPRHFCWGEHCGNYCKYHRGRGKYVLNKNIQTFLIMGLDKFESDIDDTSYDNDQQADMLLLLVLDDEQKTCNIIQITVTLWSRLVFWALRDKG